MAIEFACPACGGTLQVDDSAAGRVIRCGGCMTALRVPAPDPHPAPPPPAPAPAPTPPSPFETEPPPARRGSSSSSAESESPDGLPTAHRVEPRGERRRRRRRPPPPPTASGNKVLIWLFVIGGVCFFGIAACCGLFTVMMPKEARWREHESKKDKGAFKVQLPAPVSKPDQALKLAHLELEKGETAEGTIPPFRTEQYLVIYRDLPSTKDRAEKNERTDKQEIDIQIGKLVKDHDTKVENDTVMTVQGFPAREVRYHNDRGGWYTARVIVADTRMYTLLVHNQVAPPNEADVRKFIDSFVITDEKLVKVGKEREAEAAKAKARKDAEKPKDPEDENKARRDPEDAEARALRVAATQVTEKAMGVAWAASRRAVADGALLVPYDGPAAGDPTDVPGLLLHIGFDGPADKPQPVAPNDRTVQLPEKAKLIPGPRGTAVVLPPGGLELRDLPDSVGDLNEAGTVAVWVKSTSPRFEAFAASVRGFRKENLSNFALGGQGAWNMDSAYGRVCGAALPDASRQSGIERNGGTWARADMADGRWHHLALVRTPNPKSETQAMAELYLDGVLLARAEAGLRLGQNLLFTQRAGFVEPSKDYPADAPAIAIDELAVYDRALTPKEIAKLAGRRTLEVAPPPRAKDE